jgi:predicted metal-binding protein
MAIKTAKTEWRDVVLVCRKCSRKLDGGFGRASDRPLAKALRKSLKAGKGRKAAVAIKETGCFDVCPKRAVVAVNAARPGALLIIPEGADMAEVSVRLGLAKPELSVVGEG